MTHRWEKELPLQFVGLFRWQIGTVNSHRSLFASHAILEKTIGKPNWTTGDSLYFFK